MSFFTGYIDQAVSNTSFLQQIEKLDGYWDWKVTVSFYIAVHLIHAHIEYHFEGKHYLTHTRVDEFINPFGNYKTKLPQNIYISYKKLYNLSRRSRYLVSDKQTIRKNKEQKLFLTYDKHYSKAIKHLEIIKNYIATQYNLKQRLAVK